MVHKKGEPVFVSLKEYISQSPTKISTTFEIRTNWYICCSVVDIGRRRALVEIFKPTNAGSAL